MGNTSTKEQGAEPRRPRMLDPRRLSSSTNTSNPNSPSTPQPPDRSVASFYNVRAGRGSRPDLSSLLGIGSSRSEDGSAIETRRESKHEREARKLEKERAARKNERERSMREEHIDGGYLVTQGVYTGPEDYNKMVVRQLMIERRIAPFWRGLGDHNESWTENQLIAAARGLKIPAPDEIPKEEETGPFARTTPQHKDMDNQNNLTVPITSRSQSYSSDTSSNIPTSPTQSMPPTSLPPHSPGPGIFRGRAKGLAALTTSSKNPGVDLLPTERHLPRDPFVNGQPMEAFLYKDVAECPICYLYYPPYINKTRCCDQAICSECFVQIKRPDPHPPGHADPSSPPPPRDETAPPPEEDELVSEPATCPFCKREEFGITYDPPFFRRGLTYVNQGQISSGALANTTSAVSSSTSLSSTPSGGQMSPDPFPRRRATSISANDASVITTDKVRPDWYQKLLNARAHASRRSAAATALHTAAYIMSGDRNQSEGRGFGNFGRRGLLRRGSGTTDLSLSGNQSAHMNMLALLAERQAAGNMNRLDGREWGPAGPGHSLAPPRGSSRQNRMEDIEDLMMMEAIRLSLASEEERRKQEEKNAKKEAKKAEKENKKREKAAKKAEKAGVYSRSGNPSSSGFNASQSDVSIPPESSSASRKGKARVRSDTEEFYDIDQPQQGTSVSGGSGQSSSNAAFAGDDAQLHLERARAMLQPGLAPSSLPLGASSYRPSHLRTTSNVSSSASSVSSTRREPHGSNSSFEASPNASGTSLVQKGSSSDTFMTGSTPGGAGTEPMFNFRSLVGMIGQDEATTISHHAERVPQGAGTEQEIESTDADATRPLAEHRPAQYSPNRDSAATMQPGDEFHETSEYPLDVTGLASEVDSAQPDVLDTTKDPQKQAEGKVEHPIGEAVTS